MLPVEQPFKTYTGLDGKPLNNGYVYFGQPNENPITAPVPVFWDAAGTIPAAQPLRTINGYIVRAGTPANVFYDGSYSQLVQDSKKRQVFYARTSDEFSIATAVRNFIKSLALRAGASLIGFSQSGDGAVPQTVEKALRERISVTQFGAVGDGVADDTEALRAAIEKAQSYEHGADVEIPFGVKCLITSTITLEYNKVGLVGNGGVIVTGTPPDDAYPWFYITHSDDARFPSYSTFCIDGIKFQSKAPLRGFLFKVEGKGIDKFAAHVKFRNLNIQGYYSSWEYGDYAFAPIIENCAVTGCNQFLRSKGVNASGAHYVVKGCLITEVGNKALNTPVFDLGAVQTYKILHCNIEAVKSPIFVSQGADLYASHNHFEVDAGVVGRPLFIVDNTDYGHMVFTSNTGFWWVTPADDVLFYTNGNRMATFVVRDNRVVVQIPQPGQDVATANFLKNQIHPFLGNKAISLQSPLNPATGQALLLSGPNCNSFSNWAFLRAFTEDLEAGGVGDPVAVVNTDVPSGPGNSLAIPRSRFASTTMFPIPENAQMAMIAHWGKTTFFTSGQVSLEIRLFNAKKQQTYIFVENITCGELNKWQRFQIGTLRSIGDKTNKYISLTYSCADGVAYQLAYPFIDFA